jgi:hypothetical protein
MNVLPTWSGNHNCSFNSFYNFLSYYQKHSWWQKLCSIT